MVGRKHDKNIENFVRENASKIASTTAEENPNKPKRCRRMYKCKDCSKEYDSFQALGGHRASHRNLKRGSATSKPKLRHVCHICGKGFEIGQSLGGHMRKHFNKAVVSYHNPDDHADSVSSIASNSNGKEVFEYDLNLTPTENEAIINTSSKLSGQRSSEDS